MLGLSNARRDEDQSQKYHHFARPRASTKLLCDEINLLLARFLLRVSFSRRALSQRLGIRTLRPGHLVYSPRILGV